MCGFSKCTESKRIPKSLKPLKGESQLIGMLSVCISQGPLKDLNSEGMYVLKGFSFPIDSQDTVQVVPVIPVYKGEAENPVVSQD